MRLTVSIISALLYAPVLLWLFSEAVVAYEMWSTGMATRSELADDMGFGLLWLITALPAAILGAILIAIFVWYYLGRRART